MYKFLWFLPDFVNVHAVPPLAQNLVTSLLTASASALPVSINCSCKVIQFPLRANVSTSRLTAAAPRPRFWTDVTVYIPAAPCSSNALAIAFIGKGRKNPCFGMLPSDRMPVYNRSLTYTHRWFISCFEWTQRCYSCSRNTSTFTVLPQLATARLQLHASMMSSCLSVCLSVAKM